MIGYTSHNNTTTIQQEGNISLNLITDVLTLPVPIDKPKARFYISKGTQFDWKYLHSDGLWYTCCTPNGWYNTFEEAIAAVEKAKELGQWNP